MFRISLLLDDPDIVDVSVGGRFEEDAHYGLDEGSSGAASVLTHGGVC